MQTMLHAPLHNHADRRGRLRSCDLMEGWTQMRLYLMLLQIHVLIPRIPNEAVASIRL